MGEQLATQPTTTAVSGSIPLPWGSVEVAWCFFEGGAASSYQGCVWRRRCLCLWQEFVLPNSASLFSPTSRLGQCYFFLTYKLAITINSAVIAKTLRLVMLQHNNVIHHFIIDIIDPCANSGYQALLSPEGPGYEASNPPCRTAPIN